jgi:hypothetical protein
LTGFTAVQRQLVRKRAGNGDPAEARCEATGVWLGEHGGEIQHRRARGMGGSRLRNRLSNAALLSCEAHRICESRDTRMYAMGFWLRAGDDPESKAIRLHGRRLVWLDDEGSYRDRDGRLLCSVPAGGDMWSPGF